MSQRGLFPDSGPDERAGATFDPTRTYRYSLWRTWDATKPRCAFVMLNPSTATESVLDPTIRRCIAYAKAWGYGGLDVGNLFALRATNPTDMLAHPEPVGPGNDEALARIARGAARVVFAWGNQGRHRRRCWVVEALFVRERPLELEAPVALVVTQEGQPAHPLYQRADAEPQPFRFNYHPPTRAVARHPLLKMPVTEDMP